MRLVRGSQTGGFKTQWSTTDNRFRDVPAATPESAEWVDSPDDPRRRGGGVPDSRAAWSASRRYGVQLPGPGDEQRVAGALSAVRSTAPIPILYNDADIHLANLVAAVLAGRGQPCVLSMPDPRMRWTAQLDAAWSEKLEPILRAAELAIDAHRSGSEPNPAKQHELAVLKSYGVPVLDLTCDLTGTTP